jgi:hypothetical protein
MTSSPTPLKFGAVPNPCNGQRPFVCSKEERLLLMSSSYGKADVRPGQRVAPIDFYTGAMFKILRTWLPKLERTRIIILSAKYGLVGKEWPKIAPYGARPLTPSKAKRLIENGINCSFDHWGRLPQDRCRGPSPRQLLKPYLSRQWHDIFIVAGGEYRQVFHAFISQLTEIGVVSPTASINEVKGDLGEQLRQFEEYLRGLDLSITSSILTPVGEITRSGRSNDPAQSRRLY